MRSKKIVLFFRDYRYFQGGHLKVWDYFNHVLSSETFQPYIVFSKDTIWEPANPWFELKENKSTMILSIKDEISPDVLFIAGNDWLFLDEHERKYSPIPIINLIQHIRHSDPEIELFSFLKYKAIRICVSKEVEKAILNTGKVNGPVYTIENCINLDALPSPIDYKNKKIRIN